MGRGAVGRGLKVESCGSRGRGGRGGCEGNLIWEGWEGGNTESAKQQNCETTTERNIDSTKLRNNKSAILRKYETTKVRNNERAKQQK